MPPKASSSGSSSAGGGRAAFSAAAAAPARQDASSAHAPQPQPSSQPDTFAAEKLQWALAVPLQQRQPSVQAFIDSCECTTEATRLLAAAPLEQLPGPTKLRALLLLLKAHWSSDGRSPPVPGLDLLSYSWQAPELAKQNLLELLTQDPSVHHRELQPLYTLAATAAYVVLLAVTATTYSQAASLANSTAPLISQSTSSRRLSAGLDWEEQVSLDDAAGVLERLLQPIRQWRPQLQEQLAGLGDAPLTIRQMELELLSQLAVVHTWAATPDGAYCGGRINQQHAAAGRAAFSKALELSDGEFYNAGVLAALSNLLRRTGAEAEGQAALRRAVAAARAAGDSFRELNAASALATAIPGQDGWSYREVEGLVVVMQRCLQDCKPWLPSRLWSNHRESGLCSGCGGHSTELKFCARCRTAQYCSRACQAQHWRAGHKAECVPVEASAGGGKGRSRGGS